jgi:hypothetical protein
MQESAPQRRVRGHEEREIIPRSIAEQLAHLRRQQRQHRAQQRQPFGVLDDLCARSRKHSEMRMA